MSTAFNTRPVLGFITEGTTFAIMLGLTFASAAALALPAGPRTPLAATEAATPVAAAKPIVHTLPTVFVTGKSKRS